MGARSKLTSRLVGVLAVLVLIGTACGGSDDGEPSAEGDDSPSEQPDDTSSPTADDEPADTDDADAEDDEWAQVVEAAQAEGSVVLYHAKAPENADAILAAFEEKYGIPGEHVRLTTGPIIQRFEEELAAGSLGVDVAMIGDTNWPRQFADAGELLEVTGPAAEGYGDDNINDGVVTMGLTPLAIIYNTETVDPPPTDWGDMADRDDLRVGVPDATASNTWAATYHLLIQLMGEDYLAAIGKQDPAIGQTSVTVAQSIAAGEVDWSGWGFDYNLNLFEGEDAPIGLVHPTSGTFVFTQVAFVHQDAPHPNAGRLLLDFLMSPEGQEILNGNNEGVSPLEGVPGTIELGDDVNVIPIDLQQITEEELQAAKDAYSEYIAP